MVAFYIIWMFFNYGIHVTNVRPLDIIAAACFSIYAFAELKKQLKNLDELCFIFISPTFVQEMSKKEKRVLYS